MKNTIKPLFVLLLSIWLASISFAQRQTGSVAGNVMDNEGAPLPGASITLSGPAMMGTLTYTTTDDGNFRFPAVPPGADYVLIVEISGFQKFVREGIIVNVGKTVRFDIQLKPVTLAEEVTVTAPSPTVDVTSTKRSVTYSKDLMQNIPLARNYYSIIESAPGVIGTGYRPIIHGADNSSNQVALDGVSITSRGMGVNAIQVSFDIFEEVELETGAHPAEVGMAPGAYVNIVSKSGGNTFHGSALSYYYNQDMVRSLIPMAEAKAIGLTTPTGYKSLYDFSGTLGGPILKDKLWFFVNGRFSGYKETSETITNGVFDRPHDEIMAFGKFTFQLHPKLKITAMGSLRNYNEPISKIYQSQSYYIDKLVSYNIDNAKDRVALGMVNWVLNQNTFLDMRFMYSDAIVPCNENPDLDPKGPRYYDTYTRITTGLYDYYYDEYFGGYQGVLSLNRFLDDFLGGNHEIKAGIEYERANFELPFWRQNPITMQYTYKGLPWGYHDATPYMGYFEAATVGEKKGDWPLDIHVRRYSAYVQDSVTIKNRLTLNFGLRYDQQHADLPEARLNPFGATSPVLRMLAPNIFRETVFPEVKNLVVWKDLSPRFGLVYDLFGDNTTSLKASWSRYNQFLIGNFFIYVAPTHPQVNSFYWYDLNQNGIIETTDSFKPIYISISPLNFNPDDVIDPNVKSSYYDEINAGIERELFKDFSLSVSYIYKERFRTPIKVEKFRGYKADSGWWIPVTAADPGNDGKLGTADDKQVTAYAVKKGAPASKDLLTNVSDAKRKYQALEFVFQKRMSHGWQVLGSLIWSKLEGDYERSTPGGSPLNPNFFVNKYGLLPDDRPIVLKLQGSVLLPLGFMASGYYAYFPGAPWGRTLQIQTPNDPNIYEYPGTFIQAVQAEPRIRRFHATNNLDLRVEKLFGVGNFGKLGLFLDVLNALGDKGYTINQDSGGRIYSNGTFQRWPTYGAFTGIYGQRTYKVSARFTF